MKVRVSMLGATAAVELEEDKAKKVFKELAGQLLIFGLGGGTAVHEPVQEPLIESMPEPVQEKIPEQDIADQEPEEEVESETDQEQELSAAFTEPSTGYGGFLYIKCPECGEIKGFCAKVRIHNFRCGCGSVTRLEHLVPLYMNCECGRKSRYLTNMTESMFDMTCYDCGSPVAITWNDNKKQYETM